MTFNKYITLCFRHATTVDILLSLYRIVNFYSLEYSLQLWAIVILLWKAKCCFDRLHSKIKWVSKSMIMADMQLKRNSLARSEFEAWRTWTTFKIYRLHVMFTYERWKLNLNLNLLYTFTLLSRDLAIKHKHTIFLVSSEIKDFFLLAHV